MTTPKRYITSRGFHVYDEITDDYGNTTVLVYESSAASGPHVWVALETNGPTDLAAHLNVEQTKRLRDALDTHLKEIYQRWDLSTLNEDEKG